MITQLVLLILTGSFLVSTNAATEIYFKTLVSEKGYVFGKATAEIDSRHVLAVKYDQFVVDFEHSMQFSAVLSSLDGVLISKSCADFQDEFTVDLSPTQNGSVQINLENEYGIQHALYFIQYANNKINVIDGQCDNYDSLPISSQCICDPAATNTEVCDTAKLTHCYKLSITNKPTELSNTLPSFKLQLEKEFDPNAVVPTKFYAFDDMTQQFYTVAWEEVTNDTEAFPKDPNYNRLRVRIAPTNENVIPKLQKTHFIITNFYNTWQNTPVLFDNAFCLSIKAPNAFFLTCTCCEFNINDKDCKTVHKDPNESNRGLITDVYFAAISYLQPSNGYVSLTGQLWIENDSKFRINFDKFQISQNEVEFELETMAGETQKDIIDCTNPKSQKWCEVDVADDITKIKLNVKTLVLTQQSIFEIDVRSQQVKVTACSQKTLGGTGKICLCESTDLINSNCHLHNDQLVACSDKFSSYASSDIWFQLVINDENKASFNEPLTESKTLTLVDSLTTNAYEYYLIKFDPPSPGNMVYGTTKNWPMSVYIVQTYENSGGKNSIAPHNLNIDARKITYFDYAHCRFDQNRLSCYCCTNNKKDSSSQCESSTPYAFQFSKSVPGYGFLTGSGVVWMKETEFAVIWDQQNLYGRNTHVRLSGRSQATTGFCDFNTRCKFDISVGNGVYVAFSIDEQASIANAGDIGTLNGGGVSGQDGKCIDDTFGSNSVDKFCVCSMDVRYGTDDCRVDQPVSCTAVSNGGVPSVGFAVDKFDKPTTIHGQQVVLAKAGTDFFQIVYEPLDKLASKHFLDGENFRMRIQTSYFNNFERKLPAVDGSLDNLQSKSSLYLFEEASCQVIRSAGKDNVLCTCCDSSQAASDNACNPVTTKETQLNVKFIKSVDSYGFFFGHFTITIDSNGVFFVQWLQTVKTYKHQNRFKAHKKDGGEVNCIGEKQCLFNLGEKIQDDTVAFYFNLIDDEGNSVGTESFVVANFEIENGTFKASTECGSETLKGGKNRYCPIDKDLESACGSSFGIQKCSTITSTNKQIGGKEHNVAAFSLKFDDSPSDGNVAYVFDTNAAYSFVYQAKQQLDKNNKFNDYLIYLSPVSAINQTPMPKIELNFDPKDKIVIFDNVKCTVNDQTTEWLCECFLSDTCNKHEEQQRLTTLFQPNTQQSQKMTAVPEQNTQTTQITQQITTTDPPIIKPTYNSEEDQCKNPTNEKTKKLCDLNENSVIDDIKQMNITNVEDSGLNVLSETFVKFSNVTGATETQRVKVIQLFDQVLAINDSVFQANGRKVSDSLLDSLHKVVSENKGDLSYTNGTTFAVQKKTLACNDSQKWMGMGDDGKQFWDRNKEEDTTDQSSIQLSMDTLCKNKGNNDAVPAYFMIFRNNKLFKQREVFDDENSTDTEEEQQKNRCKKRYASTNDLILTSVLIEAAKNTDVLAKLRFKKEQFKVPPHGNLAVTWWNKTAGWSEERQCSFKEEGDEYVAHCDHLTDFALLVEKSATDPLLCDTFLDNFGFYLSLISLIGLCVLALVFATRLVPIVRDYGLVRLINNQRRSGEDTIMVVYVLCMCSFYFTFLIFIDQSLTKSALFCKLTAAYLYDLFLTAMFLNIFQAWSMVKNCAWNSNVERILLIATKIWIILPVSLAIPFLICLIIWFADTGFFYRNDQFCWIRPQSVILAVLIPVTLMLLNSFVTFVIFCVRMFPDFFARFGIKRSAIRMASSEKSQRTMNLNLFIILIFAQFILGFPWILQYPAMFTSNSTAWHYLFAIFNGTNGLIMFLIFVYGRAQAFYRLRKEHNNLRQTLFTSANDRNSESFD